MHRDLAGPIGMIQETIDQGLLAAIWTRPVRRIQADVQDGRNGPRQGPSRLVWGVNVAFAINPLDQRMVRRVTCLLPSIAPGDRRGAVALIQEFIAAFPPRQITAVEDASSLTHWIFEAIHRDVRPSGSAHFGRAADFLALTREGSGRASRPLPAGDFAQ